MIVIILIISGVQMASASIQVTHLLEQKFQALVMPAGYTDKLFVRSKTDCARICAPDNLCKSIFYMTDSRQCQTHTQRYAATDTELVVNSSALYYEKEDSATTTSTMAPTTTTAAVTPTVFTCPPDDTAFRPVTLSDGTQFSYRVFMDRSRTFSQAVTKCSNHGSTLWEVVTIPKFDFTQQLMACPAYSTATVWTNIVYNTSTSIWETLTGKPVPMTSDFWYQNRPNSGGSHACVWLQDSKDHYMDDYACEDTTYTVYIICEKLM